MIQAIYREEKQLKELSAQERQDRRQLSVKPLVEAYFTWVRENISKVPEKSMKCYTKVVTGVANEI